MKPKALASRLFDRNTALNPGARGQTPSLWTKYERQVDCTDQQQSTCHTDSVQQQNDGQKEKCHREIHFAFLPEKYKPLIEDESLAREEKKKKKKEKYNKMKKNVGKAFHSSWKCLMLGLYTFALGYSAPAATATTVPTWSTLFHQDGARD